ncbi:hypothetical protein PN492_10300, partial [Dolichospermum circinale CS-537/01]
GTGFGQLYFSLLMLVFSVHLLISSIGNREQGTGNREQVLDNFTFRYLCWFFPFTYLFQVFSLNINYLCAANSSLFLLTYQLKSMMPD